MHLGNGAVHIIYTFSDDISDAATSRDILDHQSSESVGMLDSSKILFTAKKLIYEATTIRILEEFDPASTRDKYKYILHFFSTVQPARTICN